MRMSCWLLILSAWTGLISGIAEQPQVKSDASGHGSADYSRWKHGPSGDAKYFPIAVWLQSPRNAARFKAAGINLYVGLWRGPTSNQLAELQAAGMDLICGQNRVAMENRDNPVIVGWMHGDEPDNAQSLGEGKGYGPPIAPEQIVRDYQRIRAADSTRPVLLNLGQGVAWDNYIGRGVRRNHPEDYALYVQGCDIASFDIYPVVHDAPEIAGKLEFVGHGVERLVKWAGGDRIVWDCIECTHISNPASKATPEQVRAEVWMSLIHGSRGLIYFVHEFKPAFKEAALLEDPELLDGITAINRQIKELAPVLNSPSLFGEVKVISPGSSGAADQPKAGQVAWMHKRSGGSQYLFTVNMRSTTAHATFAMQTEPGAKSVHVLGEKRQVALQNGAFADEFEPYQVHLYQIAGH